MVTIFKSARTRHMPSQSTEPIQQSGSVGMLTSNVHLAATVYSQSIVCLLYAIKPVRQDEVGMPLHAISVLCWDITSVVKQPVCLKHLVSVAKSSHISKTVKL